MCATVSVFNVFFVFTGFSVCSNTSKAEIDNNVAQAIRKLDVDIHATSSAVESAGIDHGDEEYVVEADIEIPEEALVQSFNRSASNFNNRSNFNYNFFRI